MKSLHTKGPWMTVYDAVTQTWEIDQGHPNGTRAQIRVAKSQNQSFEEQEANARLIAAAPAMYDMLLAVGDIVNNILNRAGIV